jgi:hypothetical protein
MTRGGRSTFLPHPSGTNNGNLGSAEELPKAQSRIDQSRFIFREYRPRVERQVEIGTPKGDDELCEVLDLRPWNSARTEG